MTIIRIMINNTSSNNKKNNSQNNRHKKNNSKNSQNNSKNNSRSKPTFASNLEHLTESLPDAVSGSGLTAPLVGIAGAQKRPQGSHKKRKKTWTNHQLRKKITKCVKNPMKTQWKYDIFGEKSLPWLERQKHDGIKRENLACFHKALLSSGRSDRGRVTRDEGSKKRDLEGGFAMSQGDL